MGHAGEQRCVVHASHNIATCFFVKCISFLLPVPLPQPLASRPAPAIPRPSLPGSLLGSLSSEEASLDSCAAPRPGQEMGLDGPLPCARTALPCQPHDGTAAAGGCQAVTVPGDRGASQALSRDLCSWPELPQALCAVGKEARCASASQPGPATPSPLCLGPVLPPVHGALTAGRAPAPAADLRCMEWPAAERSRLEGEQPGPGAVHTRCVSGARLLFFTEIFFLHRSSRSE